MTTGYQTVTLGKGRHDSPEQGACVIELASMLAGERFSDHPASVCPVIAGFLRGYNDLLPAGEEDELYAYASRVVGTAAPAAVRRERARRALEWAGRRRPRAPPVRLRRWDLVLLPAVQAALRMPRDLRRERVVALLDELIAMGRTPEAVTPVAGRHTDARGKPAATAPHRPERTRRVRAPPAERAVRRAAVAARLRAVRMARGRGDAAARRDGLDPVADADDRRAGHHGGGRRRRRLSAHRVAQAPPRVAGRGVDPRPA